MMLKIYLKMLLKRVCNRNNYTKKLLGCFSKKKTSRILNYFPRFLQLSPGAPPAPVRLPGQKFFEEKFSPFQWTGRWKFATNGGSSQHFYRRLNASKSARIERREDRKKRGSAYIAKISAFQEFKFYAAFTCFTSCITSHV